MSFDVDILDWNADGRGRGRHGTKVVLVSRAHPGERVRVRVDRTTRGTVQGRVSERSGMASDTAALRWPHRDHPCRHGRTCTGCPWLSLDDRAEAELKKERLETWLGALELPDATTLAGIVEPLSRPSDAFHYRYYTKQILGRRQGRTFAGSHVAGTHELADNAGCPVLVPELAALVDGVVGAIDRLGLWIDRPLSKHRGDAAGGKKRDGGKKNDPSGPRVGLRHLVARQSRATGEQILTLVTATAPDTAGAEKERALCEEMVDSLPNLVGVHLLVDRDAGNHLLAGEPILAVGRDHIEDELAGFRHRIGPTSFFQINPVAADTMIRRAVEMAGGGELALEGFCGVGALTLPLARSFGRVLAVESSAEAVEGLRASARLAGLGDRIEAVVDDARVRLPAWLRSHRPQAIVLDPPRKGMGAELARAIAESSVERVVLLSCDPSRLPADLEPLLVAGFRLARVLPIDPFPRTVHFETVTLLERT